MKRIFTLFIFFFVGFEIAVAQTPITLSNTNMPGNNDTLRYSNAQISSIGNYTQTGTNFVWNFSSLVPVSQGVRDFKNALSTPYSIFFLSFTGTGEKIADTLISLPLVTITNYYLYYRKSTSNPNAYLGDGVGLTIGGVPVPSYYTDKDEIYNFPMTYPKYDSTTFRFSTPASTLIPFVYSSTGTRATKVDGWGTITTPFGTAPCLRLVSNVYAKDSIKTSFLPIPFNNNTRSYQWLTNVQVNGKNVRIPMLEVTGNVVNNNFTPTQVRYRDNVQIIAGMKEKDLVAQLNFYPNPVKEQLFFQNSAVLDGVEISILNSEGKRVFIKTIRSNEFNAQGSLNLESLPKGLYTVLLMKGEQKDGFKFIKQ
jgi:hypothetical protein